MRSSNEDHRFKVQQIDKKAWVRTTLINAAADYSAGYRSVVKRFLASRREPEFQFLQEWLRDWPGRRLYEFIHDHRHESLLILVMMLTGSCNADCTICFTDRRRKAFELKPLERDRVLHEARRLGTCFVYVPGEGEPTIDSGFWHFLDACRQLDLEAVIFTNGILLSDAVSCRRYWGLHPDEAVRRLCHYPVSLYFKFWSTRPHLVEEMMNVPAGIYHYTRYGDTPVPAGLARLLDNFPRERLGIEVVVERRNAEEVAGEIVPFAQRYTLARIVEMIQHNGRLFNDGSFDPTPEQAQLALSLLSPTSCSMATCKAVVTSRGFLSPRIAVLEDQIPGRPVNVRSGKLFHLLHHTDYVVERRYDVVNCLCEKIPMELASARSKPVSFVPITNILPASLPLAAHQSEPPPSTVEEVNQLEG